MMFEDFTRIEVPLFRDVPRRRNNFLCVYRHKSFSRVAFESYTPQSALSA
jgi:hypothetical protein